MPKRDSCLYEAIHKVQNLDLCFEMVNNDMDEIVTLTWMVFLLTHFTLLTLFTI